MECPLGHILIEISQIRIVVNGLVEWIPTVMFREFLCQRRFPGTNISANCNVL